MKNYSILFTVSLITCICALLNFNDESHPEVVSTLAKSGIFVSVAGLTFIAFCSNFLNKMSMKK